MKPMACFCEVFERGAVMSEIKGLFEKVKIENLMAFLVYGTDSEGESIDDYEEKLEGSYDSFLSGLERKYPGIDRNDNELMDMISDFAGAHDHVYFEAGALTGFRLCRNMDRTWDISDSVLTSSCVHKRRPVHSSNPTNPLKTFSSQ